MANSSIGKFIVGFWVGALAGAAAALLLTPYSGEEMQQQIQEKGIELKGQVQGQAGKLADQAKTAATQVADTVKTQVGQVGQSGNVVLSEGAQGAQQAVDTPQS
jgi:gas vesicle protein